MASGGFWWAALTATRFCSATFRFKSTMPLRFFAAGHRSLACALDIGQKRFVDVTSDVMAVKHEVSEYVQCQRRGGWPADGLPSASRS